MLEMQILFSGPIRSWTNSGKAAQAFALICPPGSGCGIVNNSGTRSQMWLIAPSCCHVSSSSLHVSYPLAIGFRTLIIFRFDFFFFLGKTTSQIIPCFLLASVMRLTRPVWPNARNAETARAPVAPAWCRPYWIIVSTIDKCSLDWLFPSGWWDDDFEDPSCVYESFSALHGGCWLETRTTSGHVSSLRAAWIYMTICWQIFFKRLWIFGSLLG